MSKAPSDSWMNIHQHNLKILLIFFHRINNLLKQISNFLKNTYDNCLTIKKLNKINLNVKKMKKVVNLIFQLMRRLDPFVNNLLFSVMISMYTLFRLVDLYSCQLKRKCARFNIISSTTSFCYNFLCFKVKKDVL